MTLPRYSEHDIDLLQAALAYLIASGASANPIDDFGYARPADYVELAAKHMASRV